ncbi:hypothetical protein WN51_07332 [Melipona quadrifasciata]|uniref:Uncharacterized protein n=1 Tax=Melipona quadrifasciata TaxID=166423 RepID=A0A0M8ZQQ7_9HYME|nr:hypothetical protein WN51_07332 [Melipona quadrifasciata]
MDPTAKSITEPDFKPYILTTYSFHISVLALSNLMHTNYQAYSKSLFKESTYEELYSILLLTDYLSMNERSKLISDVTFDEEKKDSRKFEKNDEIPSEFECCFCTTKAALHTPMGCRENWDQGD